MTQDALVVSLSMTHLQGVLVHNSITDSVARCRRDIKRFAVGSLEYGDIQRAISELLDVGRTLHQVQIGNCTQTLAVLSAPDCSNSGFDLDELIGARREVADYV